MNRTHSITAIALTGLIGFSAISAPIAASASEEGKRNTTYALGAAALGLLLTQKNKLPGLLVAGGAAYAYSRYNNDVQARHRDEQDGYYYDNNNRRQNSDYRNRWDNGDNGNHQDNSAFNRQDNSQRFRDNSDQNNHGDNRSSDRRNVTR